MRFVPKFVVDAFEDWRRERKILGVLRKLSRQRVALILNPGKVIVIENAMTRTEDIRNALETCVFRGWIEVLHLGVPSATLGNDMKIPSPEKFCAEDSYRLTDSGWSAINRSHQLALLGIFLASISIAVAVIVQ